MKKAWWKEGVVYQVYVRSFKDSDGDGIGDLPGLAGELDYIQSLGVDAVWINPVYRSPGFDNGYDISDFFSIQEEYGTMEDMQSLINGLHQRGMRLILDMVLNHTSNEHEWFREACRSRENPYYSYYHWWPAEKGEPPFRCGFFDEEGKGWTYNEATDSYYLHYFSPQQPDLNWENPEVRRELYKVLEYWMDKGVDGFRMDAICFISKDTSWPEISAERLEKEYWGDWGRYYACGPGLHAYLEEMKSVVGRDVVVIGEASGISSDDAESFAGQLDMLYHFEGVSIGRVPGAFKKPDPEGYKLADWKEVYSRWDAALGKDGWVAVYLGNHDQPRMVSRWGDDSAASAKLLFTFLLTQRATPFIYNGDELGMTNIRFTRVENYRDIETRRMYENLKKQGGDVSGFLKDQQTMGRDNSRTPFQWTDGPQAGFTDGKPWIVVNANRGGINREADEGDEDSVLNYVRRLVRMRKDNPVLVYGEYELLAPEHPHIYAYKRKYVGQEWTVVLNFSKDRQVWEGRELEPYEAVIIGM